jgi:predicted MFS family arabinose efflux permease
MVMVQSDALQSGPGAAPRLVPLALAGLCATLVGIGLARFAYTPLIPALIGVGWLTPSQAADLGTANLGGYLVGALLAHPLAHRVSAPTVLRAMMLLVPAFAWFWAWRFGAGLAGGVIMVLAAPTVLPHAPALRRGVVGGIIFTGVGLGIAASGTLVPLLLRAGPVETWGGLGLVSAALTAATWRCWPRPALAHAGAPARVADSAAPRTTVTTYAVLLEYGLNAAGLVPHMVFLVDFIARGLDQGLAVGARYWILYGIGAMAGPLLTGRLADRIGFRNAVRVALVVQAVAVALPLVTTGAVGLALSSVIIGAFTPGIVPLAFGRLHELMPDAASTRRNWSHATISFAVLQAGGAYVCSELYGGAGGYLSLFVLGTGALLLALALDLAVGGRIVRPVEP